MVFGDIGNDGVAGLADINRREGLVLGVLAAAVLLFGLWPDPLVAVMHASVDNLIAHITVSKLPVALSAL